ALFDAMTRVVGKGEYRGLEFLQVEAKRIINRVPAASRMPFQHTINAYRGCSHACIYCFARSTHEYLGLDAGRDFERKIVVKVNAVDLTEAETGPGRWCGEPIAMGTNTDPYQPAEGKYRLTRGIVQVLGRRGNPFSILTKSPLVLRDLDVLTEAAWRTEVRVDLSIGTLDEEVWRTTEPGTPHPRKRVEALARLNRAGIPSGVLLAPVLPGLSDHPEQLREVVEACLEAGATFVSPILLHLRPGAREQYLGWLALARPDLLPAYREMYGARAYPPAALRRRLARLVGAMVGRRRRPPSQQSARGHAPAPIGPSTVGDQLRLGL
ncbi:MAG: radical SAM protein, partial [Acidimicrobiia bacterium]